MSGFLRSMGHSYLSNSIRDRQNAEQDQQMSYRAMMMAQQQQAMQEAERQRRIQDQVAAVLPGAMARPPQQVAIPGAQPMPPMGGYGQSDPNFGGGGLGAPSRPMGGSPSPAPPIQTPGGAPIRDVGAQQAPMPRSTPSPAPPPAGKPTGTQPPAYGKNGLTLDELGAYIDSQNPNMDPMAKLEVINKYRQYLTEEHQRELTDFQAGLQGRGADRADRTETRQGKYQDRMLGIMDKNADANAARANAPKKPTVAEWRYNNAVGDAESAANNIKSIIKDHKRSLGAWGKIYKGIGGLGGLMDEPTPEEAEAAYKLNVEFENLNEALGVAGTGGGMGATTFTKRWENALGDKNLLNNASRMNTQLDQILKNLQRKKAPTDGSVADPTPEPAVDNGAWAIQPVE